MGCELHLKMDKVKEYAPIVYNVEQSKKTNGILKCQHIYNILLRGIKIYYKMLVIFNFIDQVPNHFFKKKRNFISLY